MVAYDIIVPTAKAVSSHLLVSVQLHKASKIKKLLYIYVNLLIQTLINSEGERRKSEHFVKEHVFSVRWVKIFFKYEKITKKYIVRTLSYFCSLERLAMPPQKREVPRTRRRFESIEPKSEYFTTSTLCCVRARIAIISSVAFPHVAFRSPPTEQIIN